MSEEVQAVVAKEENKDTEMIVKLLKKELLHRRIQTLILVIILVGVILAGLFGKNQIIRIIKCVDTIESKVDDIDMDQINEIVDKTELTIDQVDVVVEQLDAAVATTNDVLLDLGGVADTLNDVAEKLNTVGSILRF